MYHVSLRIYFSLFKVQTQLGHIFYVLVKLINGIVDVSSVKHLSYLFTIKRNK